MLRRLALLLVIASVSGCGTFLNMSAGGGSHHSPCCSAPGPSYFAASNHPIPYGGVLTDLKWCLLVLPLLDVPLSLVADTLTLPAVAAETSNADH